MKMNRLRNNGEERGTRGRLREIAAIAAPPGVKATSSPRRDGLCCY